MAISSQNATRKPPCFYVHQFDSRNDTVADLNDWVVSVLSPSFSPDNPAFAEDAEGVLHYRGDRTMTPILDGSWIVLSGESGSIQVMTPLSFETQFDLV